MVALRSTLSFYRLPSLLCRSEAAPCNQHRCFERCTDARWSGLAWCAQHLNRIEFHRVCQNGSSGPNARLPVDMASSQALISPVTVSFSNMLPKRLAAGCSAPQRVPMPDPGFDIEAIKCHLAEALAKRARDRTGGELNSNS